MLDCFMKRISARLAWILPLIFISLSDAATLRSSRSLPVSPALIRLSRAAATAPGSRRKIESIKQLSGIAALDDSEKGGEKFIAGSEQVFQGAKPATPGTADATAASEPGLPSNEQVLTDMGIGEMSNADRVKKAIEHFQREGATGKPIYVKASEVPPLDVYDTVIIQNAGAPGKDNIYVVKKGKTDRKVLDGGHLDRVGGGSHGIIDNYSGSGAVRYHYGAMRGIETEATMIFLNFAREEEGLRGSQAWLSAFPVSETAKFDVMQNVDTEGLEGLYIMENGSTPKMQDLALEIARKNGLDLKQQVINGGDSDHTTFRRAGIPVLMVFQGTEEDIFSKIHSSRDNLSNFLVDHYRNALRLSLEVLKEIAQKPQRETVTLASAIPGFKEHPAVMVARKAYAKVDALVAKNDYAGLRRVRAAINKGANAALDPDLRQQLIRAKHSVDEMLDADRRFRGYARLVQARRLAREGRHARAARKYEQAARIYRGDGSHGHAEADFFLRLAAEQRSKAAGTAPRYRKVI